MRIPTLALNAWFPQADDVPITISGLPKGEWATPLVDVVYLMKLVTLLEPRRILEIGSYRGWTARSIAEHVPDATLVTVDIDPSHGEAYRDSEIAHRIERRVGAVDPSLFTDHDQASYDLIFVDADHKYSSVKHDTEVVLPLVRPTGVVVWHDYANWGVFSKLNGVPEYLAELAERLPVAHLAGTNMCVHSPAWAAEERSSFERMMETTKRWKNDDVLRSQLPPSCSGAA
jgi:predicted O-methyltransferase YrrM